MSFLGAAAVDVTSRARRCQLEQGGKTILPDKVALAIGYALYMRHFVQTTRVVNGGCTVADCTSHVNGAVWFRVISNVGMRAIAPNAEASGYHATPPKEGLEAAPSGDSHFHECIDTVAVT
jgi:hypothetical protein